MSRKLARMAWGNDFPIVQRWAFVSRKLTRMAMQQLAGVVIGFVDSAASTTWSEPFDPNQWEEALLVAAEPSWMHPSPRRA
mmetsp:Transcript_111185/g.313772  ORF Transcript_111185/g.313772 Transcript_111185/m.313772 type:complete len:81 (-) Transcript_111185:908-1150(-)